MTLLFAFPPAILPPDCISGLADMGAFSKSSSNLWGGFCILPDLVVTAGATLMTPSDS
ncbi:hypothetical protein AYX13_07135, partial [Cryptococcus neoformans]